MILEKEASQVKLWDGNAEVIQKFPHLQFLLNEVPIDFILELEMERDTNSSPLKLIDIFWWKKSLLDIPKSMRTKLLKDFYCKYLVNCNSLSLSTLASFKVYLKDGQSPPVGEQAYTSVKGKRFYYARPNIRKNALCAKRVLPTANLSKEIRLPWAVQINVKLAQPQSSVLSYSKDDKIFMIQNTGVGFKVSEDGRYLGTAHRERDAENYVKYRFLMREKENGAVQISEKR